jgi:hypothetical protein
LDDAEPPRRGAGDGDPGPGRGDGDPGPGRADRFDNPFREDHLVTPAGPRPPAAQRNPLSGNGTDRVPAAAASTAGDDKAPRVIDLTDGANPDPGDAAAATVHNGWPELPVHRLVTETGSMHVIDLDGPSSPTGTAERDVAATRLAGEEDPS